MSNSPTSEEILAAVRKRPGSTARQLARRFAIDDEGEAFDDFVEHLMRLQRAGLVLHLADRGWNLPGGTSFRVGVLKVDRHGQAFLVSSLPDEDDIYLRDETLGGGFHGDLVLVRITARARKGRLREARVIDVIERSRRLIRGRYWQKKKGGVVRPDPEHLPEIFIPAGQEGEARDGSRVLVRLQEVSAGREPRGRVVLRVEDEGVLRADLEVVTEEFELPGSHPRDVESEADALSPPGEGDLPAGRKDLRDLMTFTIDPDDAEDFDDAVSLESLDGGRLRLGVHIADVSHYVKPDSALDRSAEERGTSVYLPGRVIPMLPERLSNDLCSLRPEVDRFAKTVRLTFDAGGAVEKSEVFRSIIHSKRRFTYDEAQAVLDHAAGGAATSSLPADHDEFGETFASMARLRDRLQAARVERGSLQLDLPAVKVDVDPDQGVTGIATYDRKGAHMLVEEFMLAANEAVARFCAERKLPLVSRSHPPPDEAKLDDLRELLAVIGIRWRGGGESRALQQLIEQLAGSPLASVCQVALLRTMGHAEYVAGQSSHFALATDHYCHFTSPIRRYPDLLVHQILDAHFDKQLSSARRREAWESRLPAAAEYASRMERRAEDAERAMHQLCLIRYLEPRVGQKYDATVFSVHVFGFFVRLDELPVEGLVHVATLGDDYYEFDETKLRLRGRRRRRQVGLGERVRVELSGVDPDARQISFRWLRAESESPGANR